MTLPPTVPSRTPAVAAMGGFLCLAGALLLAALPPAKSEVWVGEIEGDSMSPTLWGERMAFPCRQCHRWIAFDRESAAQKSLFPCLHCGTWQIAPAAPRHVSADRVLIKKLATGQQITPEAIVVVEHPTFGLTIKRVSRLMGDQYYVLGDSPENSIDSRNPRFGLVRRAQIRGIVVKILPAIPLAGAKAK